MNTNHAFPKNEIMALQTSKKKQDKRDVLHLSCKENYLPGWHGNGHLWFLQVKGFPQTCSQGGQFPSQHCGVCQKNY